MFLSPMIKETANITYVFLQEDFWSLFNIGIFFLFI